MRLGSENGNSRRVRGHAPPGKFLENLDCLGLHLHGGKERNGI